MYSVFWWTFQILLYNAIRVFIQIVLNYFLILIGVHRGHGCKKYKLPLPFWDCFLPESIHSGWWSACRELSRCGWCDRRRSFGEQYFVLQCRINESTSWNVPRIARKYKKCTEELGFKRSTETFSSVLLLFQRCWSQSWIDQYEVPANLDLNNSARVVKSYNSIIFSMNCLVMSQ